MDIVEIEGEWIGYYAYEENGTASDLPPRVPFRVEIQRGINEFVGRIYEEAEYGGIDDNIVIRGRQNGDEIEFTKYYSLEHFYDEKSQLVSMISDSPTVVYYHGNYDRIARTFKGKWELPMLQEDDDGILHEANETGTWEIWRETQP